MFFNRGFQLPHGASNWTGKPRCLELYTVSGTVDKWIVSRSVLRGWKPACAVGGEPPGRVP